jgi:hypothetical protein
MPSELDGFAAALAETVASPAPAVSWVFDARPSVRNATTAESASP